MGKVDGDDSIVNKPLNLSVLILAKNEENNIADCIKGMLFAGEVIVIDDFSTDRTAEIAKSLGARVVQHAMEGNWGQQQTFAIEQAKYEWVYFIDADERMTDRLAEEIKRVVEKGEKYTYRNARLSYMYGQQIRHGGWFPDYGIHLFPKKGSYVTGFVHPQIHTDYPEKKLPVEAYMIHYPYRDWEHYVSKLNFYTTLAAKKKAAEGKKAGFLDIIGHSLAGFFKIFFLKSGWRDGKIGVILAFCHTYSEIMKYTKLYYLGHEGNAKK